MAAPLREHFEGAGFTIQPVYGARAFDTDQNGFLTGITYRAPWAVGPNHASCCTTGTPKPEDLVPPDHGLGACQRGNGHGFYGYFDGSNNYRSIGRVEAVIKGIGETVIGSRGFRTATAEIVALFIPSVRVTTRARYELMVDRYAGIPVFPTFEAMVAEFPPDVGGV